MHADEGNVNHGEERRKPRVELIVQKVRTIGKEEKRAAHEQVNIVVQVRPWRKPSKHNVRVAKGEIQGHIRHDDIRGGGILIVDGVVDKFGKDEQSR